MYNGIECLKSLRNQELNIKTEKLYIYIQYKNQTVIINLAEKKEVNKDVKQRRIFTRFLFNMY